MSEIQVTVGDQRGLNVQSLVNAIEGSYVTPEGRKVRVKIGRGEYVDGTPQGTLRLVDAA